MEMSSIKSEGIMTFHPMGVFLGLRVLGHFGSKTSDKENCQNS